MPKSSVTASKTETSDWLDAPTVRGYWWAWRDGENGPEIVHVEGRVPEVFWVQDISGVTHMFRDFEAKWFGPIVQPSVPLNS